MTVHLADKVMRAAAMPDVCEASQQLCAIARLLDVNPGSVHAAPLLSAVNKRLLVMLQALPESFFAPLLPQGSLSADQVLLHIFELTTLWPGYICKAVCNLQTVSARHLFIR